MVESTKKVKDPANDVGNSVQVLARAAEMLRFLGATPAGASQVEIATGLGLARTTVHRILRGLLEEGLVDPIGASSRYRIGNEIIHMANAGREALVSEIHPQLVSLSRELRETIDFSVLEKTHTLCLDQVAGLQRLRVVGEVGGTLPLHASSCGKILLSQMNDRDIDQLLPHDLPMMTKNTKNREALIAELVQIRDQGFAEDNEEFQEGLSAISIAVRGSPLGQVAITVGMPSQRYNARREEALNALIRKGAEIEKMWKASKKEN